MSAIPSIHPPPPEVIDKIRQVSERRLTAAELETFLNAPKSAEEVQNVLDLVEWFTRRYPTPLERLAYIRRAYQRWNRSLQR